MHRTKRNRTTSSPKRSPMTAHDAMQRIDTLLSHVWMVRAFIKHSDEAAEDDELASVHRDLYDVMLAVGAAVQAGDPVAYLRQARKKLGRLRRATELFVRIQPEISTHTNFQMAARSLVAAVERIGREIDAVSTTSIPTTTDEED